MKDIGQYELRTVIINRCKIFASLGFRGWCTGNIKDTCKHVYIKVKQQGDLIYIKQCLKEVGS